MSTDMFEFVPAPPFECHEQMAKLVKALPFSEFSNAMVVSKPTKEKNCGSELLQFGAVRMLRLNPVFRAFDQFETATNSRVSAAWFSFPDHAIAITDETQGTVITVFYQTAPSAKNGTIGIPARTRDPTPPAPRDDDDDDTTTDEDEDEDEDAVAPRRSGGLWSSFKSLFKGSDSSTTVPVTAVAAISTTTAKRSRKRKRGRDSSSTERDETDSKTKKKRKKKKKKRTRASTSVNPVHYLFKGITHISLPQSVWKTLALMHSRERTHAANILYALGSLLGDDTPSGITLKFDYLSDTRRFHATVIGYNSVPLHHVRLLHDFANGARFRKVWRFVRFYIDNEHNALFVVFQQIPSPAPTTRD